MAEGYIRQSWQAAHEKGNKQYTEAVGSNMEGSQHVTER
jgi:hypothetical protein